MANSVQVQKTVRNKEEFNKVVNREFTTFVKPAPIEDTDTVQELFRLYEKLFYIIPIQGEVNSHEYLLKQSSTIASFEKSTEEIQPLLDEIAQLREQLLIANQQNIDLQQQIATNVSN